MVTEVKEIKDPKKDNIYGETDYREFTGQDTINQLKIQPPERDLSSSRERENRDLHNHDGANSVRIDMRNLVGLIETTTSVPTGTPRNFSEQFKIYMDDLDAPSIVRLYFFSDKNGKWRYIDVDNFPLNSPSSSVSSSPSASASASPS